MKRQRPKRGFLDALAALQDGLSASGVPWAFIGGVAVIARGVARYTADADATVLASSVRLDAILAVLKRRAIKPRIKQAAKFARAHQVLLLEHGPSGVPLDVSLAWLPFEERAIRDAEQCPFGGMSIRVVKVEDLLTYKLIALRAHDLDDAERLIALHGRRLNLTRVKQTLADLADALDGPDRLKVLAKLVRQTAR